MALPLSSAAEDEEEELALAHGFDTTGYVQLPADYFTDLSDTQLPADHLSDSSETRRNSIRYLNDAFNGIEIPAATRNEIINGGSVAHVDGMQNQAATESVVDGSQHRNCVTNADGVENQVAGNISNIVHIDGMEIQVYGLLAGLHLSSHTHNFDDEEDIDTEDDVDESERQRTEDAAFQRAKEADDAKRRAPLPPDRCQAIKKAMQSISLGGFQPEWAGKVPENQWISRLRRKSISKSTES